MGSMMMPKYKGGAPAAQNLPTNGEMPPDVAKIGYLRKLKTMKKKYMVLRLESDVGPARLEYYDSEKKCRSGQPPKRIIVLKTCFNINRKMDSKHKFALALYTRDDCFGLVAETEIEMEAWLAALLSLQQGDADWDGDPQPKPNFEHVWQVNVRNRGLGNNRNITGLHHLCLTSKTLSLVKMKMNSEQTDLLEFPLMSIRRCGHSDDFFFMELGRSAITGCGELWMATEDNIIAQNMHEAILGAMKSSRKYEEAIPPIRPRSLSTSENNNSGKGGASGGASSSVSSRPIGVTNPQVTHGGSSSSVSAGSCATSSVRERCDSMPSRSRTVSEGHHDLSANRGNHLFDGLRPHSSVYAHSISYSPPVANHILSPGSGVGSGAYSGDSAGSSLSIDDFESDYHHSRFLTHSLEGSLHTEPTITEEPPDDYLAMSPGDGDPMGHMMLDMSSSSSHEPSGLDYMEMAMGSYQSPQTQPSRGEDLSGMAGGSAGLSGGSTSRKQMHLNLTAQQIDSCHTSPTTDYMDMASPSSALAEGTAGEGYIPMSPVGSFSVELGKRTPFTSLVSVEGHGSGSQSAETFNGYVPMAPVRENDGYMDMSMLSSSLPKNTPPATVSVPGSSYVEHSTTSRSSHSLQDISYGSSPTTHRIEEFHLDKVKSFFPPSEDDSEVYIKPARAYSIGSRPQMQKSHLAAHLETSRVRAYSFGSQAASSRRREHSNQGGIEAELGTLRNMDARNKKSSSAPLLPSGPPQTPTASVATPAAAGRPASRPSGRASGNDHNEDLMEIVYNQPAYVRMKPEEHYSSFNQPSYVRMKSDEPHGSRRYSMGSHWQRSNTRSSHDPKDKKGDLFDSSRSRRTENEYIDMPKSGGSGKPNTREDVAQNFKMDLSKKGSRKAEHGDYLDTSKDAQKTTTKLSQSLPNENSPASVAVGEGEASEGRGNKKAASRHHHNQRKGGQKKSECSDYMEMGGHPSPSLGRSAYSLDMPSVSSSQSSAAGDYVNLDMSSATWLPEASPLQQPETKPRQKPETAIVESKPIVEAAASQTGATSETQPHDYINVQPGFVVLPEDPTSEQDIIVDQLPYKANSTKVSMKRTSDVPPLVKQASAPLVTAVSKEAPAARKSSCPIPTANKNNLEGKRNHRRASQSPEHLAASDLDSSEFRRSLMEGPYENIRLGTPRPLSIERQLNYASLDLAPASSSEDAPRSPRVAKANGAEGTETTLSYAEIDFTKSEGLRTTSGSLREGRV